MLCVYLIFVVGMRWWGVMGRKKLLLFRVCFGKGYFRNRFGFKLLVSKELLVNLFRKR